LRGRSYQPFCSPFEQTAEQRQASCDTYGKAEKIEKYRNLLTFLLLYAMLSLCVEINFTNKDIFKENLL